MFLSSIQRAFLSLFKDVDWVLFLSVFAVSMAGLISMNSFVSNSSYFEKQVVWLAVSMVVFLIASTINWSFLKNTKVIVILFSISVIMLISLFAVGSVFKGAQSWFSIGAFGFQPVDPIKLVVILILAKYFSRRHMEIANIRHILVSGFYVFVIFTLVFLQPDFGSAIIIFFLWLGMVLVSGISKKHLLVVFFIGLVAFAGLWLFVFKPYQKDRIKNFINPLANIRGSGYNAYQSTIAVGSGQLLGKGIGYGTQSKLQFLPEYQTDFIFAAFAEEWGFVGVVLLFVLYGIIFYRMLRISFYGGSNFEILFGVGLTLLFLIHSVIHIGMNIGLLPVTGNTLPFMSYGGSHLLTEFFGLGMLMGMRKSSRSVHKDTAQNELVI
ncbi:MAG: rod shape determining protein RodA [Parcubacteria bacterium C7867-006]|nr:MAG: rod shape determining protein RodA [Parcubacteria bacterium C7867-006]